MKINKIYNLSLLLIAFCNSAIAGEEHSILALNVEREQVIHQYVNDLGKADYQDIATLFTKEGTVISTSKGSVNAKNFFYSFLPNIESATTEFHQAFINILDLNRYAARFHLNFKLKDGETDDGEYVDEFVFGNNSTKLTSVYMFENLKFNFNN